MQKKIAIIGAGLSGLALADALCSNGFGAVTLFEARQRVGGRILSMGDMNGSRFDVGPAWIWPHQARILAHLERLGLSVMPQHSKGCLVFEDAQGAVRRDLDFATMGDALRIKGGLSRLPRALAERLPGGVLRLEHVVTAIEQTERGVRLRIKTPSGVEAAEADAVVLALPPRLGAALEFTPALPDSLVQTMMSVPTWMAGHGKVIAVYDDAVWRADGLSGDGISHRGPLMELHDATAGETADIGAALFGFIHPHHLARASDRAAFESDVCDQLARLYGPQAGQPKTLLVKLWADERYTATQADRSLPVSHPFYAPLVITDPAWSSRLLLSGSETAAREGGVLEGALLAAEMAFDALTASG